MRSFTRFVFLFSLLFLLVNFPAIVLLKNMLSDHPGYVLLFFLMIWLLGIYALKTYSNAATKSHLPTSDE